MRDAERRYFERIEAELDEAFAIAEAAKQRGGDPEPEVEIPVAKDMADRVENILGIDGVAERVRELEGELSREEAALELVTDFVEGTVGDYSTDGGKIEGAIRTAVALLTEGVVAAPIEGIDRVEINENDDGTEYVAVYYAGPIRSAGGTAQALSVLVADYARSLLGIDQFKPRDDEIERYAEEIDLYDSETGLQYSPKAKESKFITEHCPIMLDGEATGDEEVSGFRDLERIDTNSARGGMCLVLAEGIALKAPKIQRYTRNLEEVEWPWLQDLIDGTIGKSEESDDDSTADDGDEESDDAGDADDESTTDDPDGPPRVEPSEKFLRDLIAGRPVFTHPSEAGGFRLRYGRSRNLGLATAGIHPATMHLVDDFLAPGTQIKTERPGKAAGIVPVTSIEGPTVKLANGDVRQINDAEKARAVRNGVERILDLGEYLVNYGEFIENNHPLAPAGYAPEWWRLELAETEADVQALEDDISVDLDAPTVDRALHWARKYDAPLHPEYTYCWHDIDAEAFETLAEAVADGQLVDTDGGTAARQGGEDRDRVEELVLDRSPAVCETLETLLVEHTQHDEQVVVPTWRPLALTLGLDESLERQWNTLSGDAPEWPNAMRAVAEVAPFTVRELAPTRIGNRMGRPEKSEERELSPAVHTLFPIGEAGGTQRDVAAAATHTDSMQDTPGELDLQVGKRYCTECDLETFETRCPNCEAHLDPEYWCPDCEQFLEPDESGRVFCERCEAEGTCVEPRTIDIHEHYRDALESVGERENAFDILKGVKGLSSATKTPEPIEKGILRAKHDVSAFKDGTIRYDMTDLPVTAVKPSELDVTAEQFRQLGYETDIHGDPLQHDDQVVELRVQDVVLSDGAADHLLRTADFIDDLLTAYYGMEPYYELDDRQELVGELVFGMAPHTSAAVVGRVVGFSSVAAGYAHPYFHAAKRRNCFHPETTIRYLDADGRSQTTTIDSFVEQRLEEPIEDDFGTLHTELGDGGNAADGTVSVPSLTTAGVPTSASVTAVSKHPAPDHLIEITTAGGESLTVTPDHILLRWTEDGAETIEAMALEVGDAVPVAANESSYSDRTLSTPEETRTESDRPQVETVTGVQTVTADVEYTYCLTVERTHTLVANGIYSGQCDGDEDCVMLLMDGLLNFSRTYLPDQRGGSVAADTRLVAVDPEGNVRFLTVEEFWNAFDTPVSRDGKFTKKACLEEGWQTYAFDDEHEATLQPIEKAIRYQSAPDEQLLSVTTQFGRSIDITTDHSLFRYDDGIEAVAGDDLEAGDLIVAPKDLSVPTREPTIDATDCLDDPYVLIDDRVEDLLRTAWESTNRGSETHKHFEYGLSHRLSKSKLPVERFEQILQSAGLEVPADVQIGLKGSTDGISRTVELDEDVGWLLGLFVAEGSTSSFCPTIYNTDEELLDRASAIFEEQWGHKPGRRWSSDTYELRFPAVFREVLYGLGFVDSDSYDSSEKLVPELIRHAPRAIVCAFIRGFIAGDGSKSSDDNYTGINFHTTSEQVKDGIVFLLHRLGLVANISTKTGRDGNRQDIYTVSVSGGASDNPLQRVLDGDQAYDPKSLVVAIPEALRSLRSCDIDDKSDLLPSYLARRENISLAKLRGIVRELESRELPQEAAELLEELRPLVDGDLAYLRVQSIECVPYDGYLYDLQVGGEPIFTANWLYAHNSMDAPLVMSSRIDPTEIDDEAHNVDVVGEYPLELYEASRELADPEDVDVEIAEDTLGTDAEYSGFRHTHEVEDIAAGPDLSAYKTLGSMMEKMDAQLELARKLDAVDETDVAERVIEYHFLPDLIGNLRAFSRQETRCLDCGEKYRRMPLTGDCRECGGDVNLTVHEGSVNKYMDTAIEVAEEYGARTYTKQRLEVLERALDRIFENDNNKQSGIADFM